MESAEDIRNVEALQKLLKSHFGHSSTDGDIEDAAWTVYNFAEAGYRS